MLKHRLTIKEYFKNMATKTKGIKLLLTILSLIIVLPLVFGLSFLSLRSNNDLVDESVKNYKQAEMNTLKAELKYDMDIIIDMLDSYYKKHTDNNLNKQSAQQLSVNMLSTHNMSSASAIYWIEANNKQLVASNLTTDNQITNRDQLQDANGVFYVNKIFEDLESTESTYNNFYFNDSETDDVNEYTTYSVKYEPWDWVITVGTSSQELNDSIASHETTLKKISKEKTIRMFILGLIFGVLVFGISSYIGMSIAVNANKILNITNLMKTGDLSHRLKLYSKDELEETADSLNIALDQISSLIRGINDISSTLDTSVNNFSQNQSRMNSTIENVSSAIINITENVNEQAQSTAEVSYNINEISSNIQTTVNELNILENNSNTMINYSNKSSESLQELLKINNRTQKDLDKMVTHTSLTNDSVSKISNAAELINDIAEQTNLLSLNASIEAARAGEQGKGFAIVASEIGVLAAQSAKTVTEINSILEELNTNSSKSLEIMNEMTSASSIQNETLLDTSNVFNELKLSLDACAQSINNISLRINEIDTKKGNIVNNIRKLNTLSENNAAYTEETSAMTEELTSAVKHSSRDIANLAEEFDTLKERLKKFTI